MEDGLPIKSAGDMFRLLRGIFDQGATTFTKAQHEKAFWEYDNPRTAFWQAVMDLLQGHGQLVATCVLGRPFQRDGYFKPHALPGRMKRVAARGLFEQNPDMASLSRGCPVVASANYEPYWLD